MGLCAKEMLDYRDLNAFCAIRCALNSVPIKALKKEWKRINKKYAKIVDAVSSAKIAEMHSLTNGPLIPHFGAVLKNIESIKESKGAKMKMLETEMEKVKKWQTECCKVYDFDEKQRKIDAANKKFVIATDLVLQKLLLLEFERQIGLTDDQILK